MRTVPDQRGFTLVELLVALTLATLVAGFMLATVIGSQRATMTVTDQIENRQNARTALQLLERDLRMAGSGWGRAEVQGCFNGTPLTILPITPGYGGTVASNDTIGMIGAWDAVTSLTTLMSAYDKAIKVSSTSGFSDNDFCVITNGTNAHLFQITNVNKGTNTFAHNTTSLYNVAGGHQNFPSVGYPVGTLVYRASWVSYFVDTTKATRLKLVRREAGRPDQLVAYDVRQFKISYRLQDETESRNPGDPSTIERLSPVVLTRTDLPGEAMLADSASTIIRPRSF